MSNDNRITEEHVHETVLTELYHVFPGTTQTVCCLTLKNGFTVVGESACVDPNNFDAQLGRQYAREDAMRKVWELEGYLLQQRMHEGKAAAPSNEDVEALVDDLTS